MGWIRIKNGQDRLLIDSTMQYIACISKDKKIKVFEVEKLFEIVKAQGRQIDRAEFDELEKTLREKNKKWWNSYRKNFTGKYKEKGDEN